MSTTYIFVNKQLIAENRERAEKRPPIRVLRDGRMRAAFSLEITGPSRVVYDPENPVEGVECWIETEADVIIKK